MWCCHDDLLAPCELLTQSVFKLLKGVCDSDAVTEIAECESPTQALAVQFMCSCQADIEGVLCAPPLAQKKYRL